MDVDRLIRERFRVKQHDTLPYAGWANTTRNDLPALFRDLGYTVGAEIGVAQGTYTQKLLEGMPGLHLYAVDPWQPYQRISQAVCDERKARYAERVSGYNVSILPMASLEASFLIDDGALDFVYVDGDHRFDAVMLDLILWAPKVRPGGIVAGHDYFHFYQSGVCPAVDAYTVAHEIRSWYVTKEKEASFLWVQRTPNGAQRG